MTSGGKMKKYAIKKILFFLKKPRFSHKILYKNSFFPWTKKEKITFILYLSEINFKFSYFILKILSSSMNS